MNVNVRKEQLLFLFVVLLAVWIWSGRSTATLPRSAAPQKKDYAAEAPPVVVLADVEKPVPAERDLFREPTEATPLPPRQLPFPPLAPLPVIAPPLEPGQDAGAWYQLRMAGGPPVEHAFAEPEDGGGGAAAAGGDEIPGVVPQQGQRIPEEVLIERFDRIWLDTPTPFFGNILNQNKLDLAGTGPWNEPIEFEHVSRLSGRVTNTETHAPDEIQRIELADNLENKIAFRKRELPDGPAGVPLREQFLQFLIEQARDREWVWAEAEEQAQRIFDITQNEVGYKALLRVFRAKGDLAAELAIYQSLKGDVADLPARWREQGRFEAELGLLADAEAHMRKAVAMSPNDARNTGALAEFLLARGRAGEAVPHAERALRGIAQVTDEEQRLDVAYAIVGTLLAVGRTEDAVIALGRAGGGNAARRAYLRGTVHYAVGELDEAAEQFDRAAEELGTLHAVYGLGACALRQGRWDEAKQLLERVRDDAPALRGRALAALGLLYERTGHDDESREALIDAERTAPREPYVLYLVGRRQRLDGEYDAAVSTLRRALAERDEMTAALAETAYALLARAAASDIDAPEVLARTVRYVDRLVELDRERGVYVPFLELQGYVLATVGEVAQARRAFQAGYAAGSDFSEIGLALLDYGQKRVGDARAALAGIANDPGRGGIREFARTLVDLIDDHASKEQVRDSFARDEVGELWETVGALRPFLRDEALVMKGNSGPIGQESAVRRTVRAGDLIRVEVQMTLRGDVATTEFAGLRLQPEGRQGRFELEFGVRSYGARKQPEIRIQDGATNAGEEEDPIALDVDFDPNAPVALALEFVPSPDPSTRTITLRAWWNDRLVLERPLKSIRTNTTSALATDLVVRGRPVHVAFDDYRLVRRKEIR